MFEKNTALYTTGEVHSSHDEAHEFPPENLAAVVTHYHDGNRKIIWNDKFEPKTDFEKSVALHVEKMGEFKHDGGTTPEIQHLRKAHL